MNSVHVPTVTSMPSWERWCLACAAIAAILPSILVPASMIDRWGLSSPNPDFAFPVLLPGGAFAFILSCLALWGTVRRRQTQLATLAAATGAGFGLLLAVAAVSKTGSDFLSFTMVFVVVLPSCVLLLVAGCLLIYELLPRRRNPWLLFPGAQ